MICAAVKAFASAVLLLCFAFPLFAFKHQMQTVSIPTRDGKFLVADVYLPAAAGQWPAILIQTPYDRRTFRLVFRLEVSDDPLLKSPDYAFVVVDWRGFFDSAPAAVPGYDRGDDGYDTIEWIAQQNWSDGKVGTWGASALGLIQFQTASKKPPHLKACVPIVAHARESYDLYYGGGVYYRNKNSFVNSYFGLGQVIQQHPLYDATWQAVETAGLSLSQIDVPMLHISGWYDHETDISIREMLELDTEGGPNAKSGQKMLIGPWSHSHIGALQQGELSYPAALYESSRAALECFDFYLRGINNGYQSRGRFRYFQTNEDRWVSSDVWPPLEAQAKRYYLTPGKNLDSVVPSSNNAAVNYISDPSNPVPTRFGAILIEDGVTTQGPGDLREIDNRSDVIIFSTPALAEPMKLAGRPQAILFISADGIDTDLAVRMTQVFPDGRSVLLVDGISRASLRASLSKKEMLSPNQVYRVQVDLPSLAVTIPPGHRLRISIASSNYDRFDKNMQDGSSFSNTPGSKAIAGNIHIHTNTKYISELRIPTISPMSAAEWMLY